MLREAPSELKLSLKMNSLEKKLKNEKLFVNRKGMQEGDFTHMYAADASFHSCLFCCLLATFFLWAKLFKSSS